MELEKYIWAFNFDLLEDELQRYYSKSRSYAWTEIKNFFEDNGFTHRQYSGYISQVKLDRYDIEKFVNTLQQKFPWFERCADVADFTIQGVVFDSLSQMRKNTLKNNPKIDFDRIDKLLVDDEIKLEDVSNNSFGSIVNSQGELNLINTQTGSQITSSQENIAPINQVRNNSTIFK